MTQPRSSPLALLIVAACSTYTIATWNPVVEDGTGAKFAAFAQAQLDSVRSANPTADALARIEAGDSAFLALQGYAPIIPGYVPDWEPLIKKHGLHMLVPGCEVIYARAQVEFCDAAEGYAARYNATLVSRMRGQPP